MKANLCKMILSFLILERIFQFFGNISIKIDTRLRRNKIIHLTFKMTEAAQKLFRICSIESVKIQCHLKQNIWFDDSNEKD